jgi:IS5 family transposase
LSDGELEEALRIRLDFMVMTGLEEVPDATTVCRFRNKLMELNLFEPIFESINHQLERDGIKVEKASGAIVDATIITSAARPRKEIEAIAVDRCEDTTHCAISDVTLSKDLDATWLKKGKKSYFGYKGFVVTDARDGFMTQVHVTPAHVSEVRTLETLVSSGKMAGRLYADKGYASAENKALLRQRSLKNGIMEKAQKNHPLRASQKRFNYLISRQRYRVEQCFGTLKRGFNFSRATYMTRPKVLGQMLLKGIAFNLLKAANKVFPKEIAQKIVLQRA